MTFSFLINFKFSLFVPDKVPYNNYCQSQNKADKIHVASHDKHREEHKEHDQYFPDDQISHFFSVFFSPSIISLILSYIKLPAVNTASIIAKVESVEYPTKNPTNTTARKPMM